MATPSIETSAVGWIKTHERLLIVFMVLTVGAFLGNKWLDSSAAKANATATYAAQQAVEAKKDATLAAQQAAQTQAQYQAMVTALSQQNAVLAQAITQRDAILGRQQTAVQTAPLNDVAVEWQTAIGGTGDITPNTNGLNVTDSGARKTVTQLLELPVVKADLADQTEVVNNLKTQLTGSDKNTAACYTQVSALNAQLNANDVASKAEIVALKAEGKKNRVKWFKRGFIVGFIAGLWTGHAAGL